MNAGFVYMMANRKNGTIYTGVTSDLAARTHAHREGLIGGFTKQHGCKSLVWFEAFDDLQRRAGASCRSRSGSGRGKFG